jgi:NADH:ubiquinone oxidoreductase subunit 4 (subunit M)
MKEKKLVNMLTIWGIILFSWIIFLIVFCGITDIGDENFNSKLSEFLSSKSVPSWKQIVSSILGLLVLLSTIILVITFFLDMNKIERASKKFIKENGLNGDLRL